jgi:hypothetical protein
MPKLRKSRTPAQALVEFALAATTIFFLLAAVVDLGLIYFTMQALRVAAQEGAAYGSYPRVVMNGNRIQDVTIDYSEVVYRVYGAGGEQGGGFANLRDLNNNGQDDLNVDRLHDNMATDPDAYIYIENLAGFNPNSLSPSCRGDLPGQQLQNGGRGCWIRVTVRYEYRFLFPMAPAFGDTVRLQASHLTPMRSTIFTTAN